MTRGLPGSGKSHWAKQQQELDQDLVIVTKDDIRKELEAGGWKWSKENEKHVIAIRDDRIRQALREGRDVISADTNFGRHKGDLEKIARECKAEFVVKDFTLVPVETCIERDAKRERSVGAGVIKDMYNKYLAMDLEPYIPVPGTPPAIICDLDGTLALHEGRRSPYDYAKCDKDTLNKPIYSIIRLFADQGYRILYVSGREEWCRNQTEDFLATNNCPKGELLMRPSGDHRKDFVVKKEIFDNSIRKVYNVKFVLDDRTQVVKMWRGLGLTCLQVAEGDF